MPMNHCEWFVVKTEISKHIVELISDLDLIYSRLIIISINYSIVRVKVRVNLNKLLYEKNTVKRLIWT